jgi:hypothetical protein
MPWSPQTNRPPEACIDLAPLFADKNFNFHLVIGQSRIRVFSGTVSASICVDPIYAALPPIYPQRGLFPVK